MSGLAGLLLMSMLCGRGLDVYGFDTGDEPPGTPYHYYDRGAAAPALASSLPTGAQPPAKTARHGYVAY